MATNNILNVGLSGFTGSGAFAGSVSPTFTTPILGAATITSLQYNSLVGLIKDSNGNNLIQFGGNASAVNYVQIQNNITNGFPIFSAAGSDTNIGLEFLAKGSGWFEFLSTATSTQFVFLTGAGYQHQSNLSFPSSAATQTYTFPDASGTVILSGASQTLGAITATSINFGGSTLSTYTTGTWTPIDASGAALTFSTATGTYQQIGNMVICTGFVVYPSTANASAAIIGGLPVVTGTTNQKMGGHVAQTTVATLAHALTLTNNTAFGLYTTSGVGVLNSAMSLSTNTFQLIYFI